MDIDILNMFETMASIGHAPEEGCSMFGVGYDDAFKRLKETYILNLFKRGGSAEKYVVGPFGSGKTHFLRQLSEISREENCVTVEISLTKDVDFTQTIFVYKEIAQEIRCPGSREHGMRNLLKSCLANVKKMAADESISEVLASGWTSGLDEYDFKLDSFGRVAKKAFEAHMERDYDTFDIAARWLSGEVDNRRLAKSLGMNPIAKVEQNLFAQRATLSLFQMIRHARFTGTLVCFDEAEQGLTVDKRKTERILSMLQARINALADLNGGSALQVYALTPDLVDKMENFAALQQRIVSPPGLSFFEGNTRAPLIDLTQRNNPERELQEIGEKLVELFFLHMGDNMAVPKEVVMSAVKRIASEVSSNDLSSSNRRTLVKMVCFLLLNTYETGELDVAVTSDSTIHEDEV